ncbi:hypothetical protein DDB_G0278223 [Dictyostelium discoideum AX4]|uniref:Uncharacterized protein n=1 Tax=Dictyostelium discoideum TaxID=44689 RepID=Q54YI7_DICDI|nr:hypothetical protein DDB_G0278223 [Dictyostelium discoideum AX4]EAL68284.1 hypothetical protein DDB_G0278223 [Dictyostelium discoideum AX4]|eukprot:XP_642215.1 hypothetical protein DDB_G0278223 [Dictyostelium discoideum AX4]
MKKENHLDNRKYGATKIEKIYFNFASITMEVLLNPRTRKNILKKKKKKMKKKKKKKFLHYLENILKKKF